MKLDPNDRKRVYEFMRSNGFSRLTIKILMGYPPDGVDRMTVMLDKATEYDYKLFEDEEFRISEVKRLLTLSKNCLKID